MAKMYVGLTDDPIQRRADHGNPRDWRVTAPFATEAAARAWEKQMLAAGYQGGPGGAGWKYGYTYTIAPGTNQ